MTVSLTSFLQALTGDWAPQPPTEAERGRWDVEWADDARAVAAAVGAPATFEMTLPAGPYLMEGYYRPGASHPDAIVVRRSSAFPWNVVFLSSLVAPAWVVSTESA